MYVEGAHPDEVPFLFERQPQRLGFAVGGSAVIQVAAVSFCSSWRAGTSPPVAPVFALLPENPNKDIIWLSEPGPAAAAVAAATR